MAHPPELRKRAKDLRKQGLLIKVIAAEIGVSEPTVARWLNPELEKRERARARKKKFSLGKKCPQCKKKVSNNSTLCRHCYPDSRRVWTRERLIEAVHQWAIDHGDAPSYWDWINSGPGHPAIRTIVASPNAPFKTWGALIEAAGFTPRKRRLRRGVYPMSIQTKEKRAALRRQQREMKIVKAMQKGGK